jgi:uncharacterized low-complexity protein
MSDQIKRKPLAFAIGTTMTLSLAAAPATAEPVNPFGLTELASGYIVGAMDDPPAQRDQDGTDGEEEGSCGEDEDKDEEGTDGEDEGSCGEEEEDKDGEGSCGEGRCSGV